MIRSHIPIPRPEKRKKVASRLQRGGRIKPVSATKAKLQKIYSALRIKFLQDHPVCQWWLLETFPTLPLERAEWIYLNQNGMGAPKSDQVHHVKGRGKYYLDTSTWMAVSSEGHRWIHDNPKLAYERKYMLPRN